MAVNLVVMDGVVQNPALRYATDGKAEYRFTLDQQDGEFHLWLPCCASGSAAERLHEQLDEGMHIMITSGRLCYRKRQTKLGEQSRMEILVWQVDRLSGSTGPGQADTGEPNSTSDEVACNLGQSGEPETKKSRKPRYGKHLHREWRPTGLISEN